MATPWKEKLKRRVCCYCDGIVTTDQIKEGKAHYWALYWSHIDCDKVRGVVNPKLVKINNEVSA